jgi:hypothetical protein
MKGKAKKPLVFLTIFASIGMGLGFALGNYVYLILALNELLGYSVRFCSLLIYCAVCVILWLVVEPEKIKPLAYILSAFIFGSATTLMFSNYTSYALGTRASDLVTWNTASSGALIGVSLFSFESISLIINGKLFSLGNT